ncbi:phosphonate C-P lyase system protein PhnH [Streptomyces sp. NPDC048297]|uniref:phosphonate C-P lyase system protein PhnH n=1 Tax=Streptomyces sp. NPDC048297 TaxID=3365531 RepID=UPI00371DCCE9
MTETPTLAPRTRTGNSTGTGTETDIGRELSAADRIRALRRTSRASQRDFDALLDVLARPGRVRTLEVPEGVPAVAVAACGLLDVEVHTHVLAGPGDTEWAESLHAATSAPRAELPRARTVVALRPVTAEDVDALDVGTPLAPENGARLFASVDALDGEGPHDVDLLLSGPGVPDGTERRLRVRGLEPAVLDALARANASFPCGVDVFLVAADGRVAGLPRTTRVRAAEAG